MEKVEAWSHVNRQISRESSLAFYTRWSSSFSKEFAKSIARFSYQCFQCPSAFVGVCAISIFVHCAWFVEFVIPAIWISLLEFCISSGSRWFRWLLSFWYLLHNLMTVILMLTKIMVFYSLRACSQWWLLRGGQALIIDIAHIAYYICWLVLYTISYIHTLDV